MLRLQSSDSYTAIKVSGEASPKQKQMTDANLSAKKVLLSVTQLLLMHY